MRQLKIANLKLSSQILLAPMVDVTDLPYRIICRKAGASLAYTEMLYIDAILNKNEKTKSLMKTSKEDKPIGIQITGSSPIQFKKLIPYTKPYNLVDLNCGCPSLRITGNQAGSYLLNNPKKIESMIKILKSGNLIVTVKIRLGFKKNNVLKIAKIIEKAGADALTLHPRLATHGNSIPANHIYTKKLSRNLTIPLIANGDIFTPQKAAELLDFADGIMIARGAIGNPLIFSRITHYLKTGREKSTPLSQNISLFQEYLKLAKKYGLVDINRIKYLASNFTKGIKYASITRQKVTSAKTIIEIEELMVEIKKASKINEELNENSYNL
jgi:tRNA-dihydrouridine synthase B